MATEQQNSKTRASAGQATQRRSRQQSLARRVLNAPGAAIKPLSKAEERVVAELRRTARHARRRVGL